MWRLGLGALGIQLVAMLVFSTIQYRRFELTFDFSGYAQVWTSIAHGHLDPYSSTWGIRFWRNNLELVLWPLALAYHLYPHTIDLLWLQDLTVVLTEAVALAWIRDLLAASTLPEQHRTRLLGLGALLLVVDPWAWTTIDFDLHTEPLAALFVVLAARALWAGRTRWLLLWVPLALCCTAVVGLYVVGIGSPGFAPAAATEGPARSSTLSGIAWLGPGLPPRRARGGGGAHPGRPVRLPRRPSRATTSASSGIVAGLLEHPGRGLSMLTPISAYLEGYLVAGGIIGLASPMGTTPGCRGPAAGRPQRQSRLHPLQRVLPELDRPPLPHRRQRHGPRPPARARPRPVPGATLEPQARNRYLAAPRRGDRVRRGGRRRGGGSQLPADHPRLPRQGRPAGRRPADRPRADLPAVPR